MKKCLTFFMIVLLATIPARAATKYEINVGGVEVTSDNASNVTGGDIKMGRISYDASTNTLTLWNVQIERDGSDEYAVHNRNCSGLTMKFVGYNSLKTVKSHTIHLDKTTHIVIDGRSSTLEVDLTQATSSNTAAIYSKNNADIYLEGYGTLYLNSVGNSSSYPSAIRGEGNNPFLYFKNCITADIRSDGYTLYNYGIYVYDDSDVTLKSPYSGYNVFSHISFLTLFDQVAICQPADAYLNESTGNLSNGASSLYITGRYGVVFSSANFPDANFRSYLRSLKNRDYLTEDELFDLTTLNVSYKGISNMKGVEKLTSLEDLRCYNNTISSLNVTNNTKLTYLDCDGNGMTSLNVSNTKLTYLDCGPNNLTSITGLPNTLATLKCNDNKFTSLSLTGRTSLTYLDCSNNTSLNSLICYQNALTNLYVTGNTALTQLKCYENPNLTSITGLGDCRALTYLDCEDCKINSLDGISYLNNLSLLWARNNRLTTLDVSYKSSLGEIRVSGNPLTSLKCYNCNLSTLNVSNCTALKELKCYNNSRLASITGLGDCTAITQLDCEDCSLTDISGVNNMTNIVSLLAGYNKLTSLTIVNKSQLNTLRVSGNTTLTTLTCNNNDLRSLNVSGCTALNTLRCYNNYSLATITGLANCNAMQKLTCYSCALTDLSAVTNMTNLDYLSCYTNQLTSLTVTNKSKLTDVLCYNNPKMTTLTVTGNSALKTLDTKNCTALKSVYCYNNALTSFNLTGNSALTDLRCYNNTSLGSITGLNNCTAIQKLYCYNCALTDLSAVNNMTNLDYLSCYNNKLTSLKVQNNSKLTDIYCYNNPNMSTLTVTANSKLATLDAKNCTSLKTVYCYNNALTSFNLTGNSALNDLRCYNNTSLGSITGLNNCTAIQKLYCYNCALTDLSVVNNMTNLDYLSCYNNKLTSLTVQNKSKLTDIYCYNNPNMSTLTVTGNSKLTTLDAKSCTALNTANCYNNALTTLNVTSNTAMTTLNCYSNQLTTLNVNNCNSLKTLYCYRNKISGSGMATLVNSLPTRSASNPGSLRVIYNTGEGNTMTTGQITTAIGKHWVPKKYNGSVWYDLTASLVGDVDNSGNVNIDDVTALINYLLSGNATGLNLDNADVYPDGRVNIDDVTALINKLLGGS